MENKKSLFVILVSLATIVEAFNGKQATYIRPKYFSVPASFFFCKELQNDSRITDSAG